MTPADLKTRAEAIAAAKAVHEARLVVYRLLKPEEDRKLFDLELSFWKRADELKKRARVADK